jgi:hypothetical protein
MFRNRSTLHVSRATALVLGLSALASVGCDPETTNEGDSQTNLEGTVTLNGQPLGGVTVVIVSADGFEGAAETRGDGTYSFSVVTGSWSVTLGSGLPADATCDPGTDQQVSVNLNQIAVANFDCMTPGGGTGGTGGMGTGGTGGTGTGGTGGTASGCNEPDVTGQAQLAAQPTADAESVSPGGQFSFSVPVDSDTREVVVTLLPEDLNIMGPPGVTRVSTDGNETVQGLLTVPGDALPKRHFLDIELHPFLPNDRQNFTFYTQTQLGPPQITYVKGVFEDGNFSNSLAPG